MFRLCNLEVPNINTVAAVLTLKYHVIRDFLKIFLFLYNNQIIIIIIIKYFIKSNFEKRKSKNIKTYDGKIWFYGYRLWYSRAFYYNSIAFWKFYLRRFCRIIDPFVCLWFLPTASHFARFYVK